MTDTSTLWQKLLQNVWQNALAEIESRLPLFIVDRYKDGYVAKVQHVRGGVVYLIDPREEARDAFQEELDDKEVQFYSVNSKDFSLVELERRLHAQLDLLPDLGELFGTGITDAEELARQMLVRGWRVDVARVSAFLENARKMPDRSDWKAFLAELPEEEDFEIHDPPDERAVCLLEHPWDVSFVIVDDRRPDTCDVLRDLTQNGWKVLCLAPIDSDLLLSRVHESVDLKSEIAHLLTEDRLQAPEIQEGLQDAGWRVGLVRVQELLAESPDLFPVSNEGYFGLNRAVASLSGIELDDGDPENADGAQDTKVNEVAAIGPVWLELLKRLPPDEEFEIEGPPESLGVCTLIHPWGLTVVLVDSNDTKVAKALKDSGHIPLALAPSDPGAVAKILCFVHDGLDLTDEIEEVLKEEDKLHYKEVAEALNECGWRISESRVAELMVDSNRFVYFSQGLFALHGQQPDSEQESNRIEEAPEEVEPLEPKQQLLEVCSARTGQTSDTSSILFKRFVERLGEYHPIAATDLDEDSVVLRHSSGIVLGLVSALSSRVQKVVSGWTEQNIAFLVVHSRYTPCSAIFDALMLAWIDEALDGGEDSLLFSEVYIGLEKAGFRVEPGQLRRLVASSPERYIQDENGVLHFQIEENQPESLKVSASASAEHPTPLAIAAPLAAPANITVDDRKQEVSLGEVLLRELVAILFEVARADEKFLPQEMRAVQDFFDEGLLLSDTDRALAKELIEQEAQTERWTAVEPEGLLRLPEPIRELVLRIAFEVAQADLEYHDKEKKVLDSLSERLRLSPEILIHLEIEFSEKVDAFQSKLATLGLSGSATRVDLDANYSKLVHRYEPAYFGQFADVFCGLAQDFRTKLEDRYSQLKANLDVYLAKHSVFDDPLAKVIYSDRTLKLLSGNGFLTVGQLLEAEPREVKSIPGLGSASWNKIRRDLSSHASRFHVLRKPVREYFETGTPYKPAPGPDAPGDVIDRKLSALRLNESFVIRAGKRGLVTLRDLLSEDAEEFKRKMGLGKKEWSELKRALISNLRETFWHSNALRFIELIEGSKEQGLSESLLAIIVDAGSAPTWKIQQKMQLRGKDLADDALSAELERLVEEQEIFDLGSRRFSTVASLRITDDQTVALQEFALAHLTSEEHLSCFERSWRGELGEVEADKVNYALSRCKQLLRREDGHYVRRSGPEQLEHPAAEKAEQIHESEEIPLWTASVEVDTKRADDDFLTASSVTVLSSTDRTFKSLQSLGCFVEIDNLPGCESPTEFRALLEADERISVVDCGGVLVGLCGWSTARLQAALEGRWPRVLRWLKSVLKEQNPSLTHGLAQSLREVCEKKEHPYLAGRLDQVMGLVEKTTVLEDAVKALERRGRPFIFAELCRMVGETKDKDDFYESLQGREAVEAYPFAGGKFVGLKAWGQPAREQVVRKCWPWIKTSLEDETQEFADYYWEAVNVVAAERDALDLIPRKHRNQDASSFMTSRPPAALTESARVAIGAQTVPFLDLLKRALKLKMPFSVAELSISQSEFDELTNWFQSMSRSELKNWFGNERSDIRAGGPTWTHAEFFGFLLLAYLSEVARRKAVEGNLWVHLPSGFGPQIKKSLFAGTYARAITRQWIEIASKKIGVRNAYGQEGTQDSYITIMLQIGFTKRGIGKLPLWLSEGANRPRSIDLLCRGTNPFSRMWTQLQAYRRGQIGRGPLREVLNSCPFILGSWVDLILESAKDTRVSASQPRHEVETVSETPIVGPFLEWSEGYEPRLWARIQPGAVSLDDYGYSVLLNDKMFGRLIKLADDSYSAEPSTVDLDLTQEESTIVFVGDDTDESFMSSVNHFLTDSSLTAFRLDKGSPVSPEEAPGSVAVALVCPMHQEFQKAWPTYELDSLGCKLVRFPTGAELIEAISVDGEVEEPEETSDLLSNLHVSCPQRRLRLGQRLEISVVGLPDTAMVAWGRVEGHCFEIREESVGLTLVGELTAVLAMKRLRVELSVRFGGRSYRIERRVSIDFKGVTMLQSGHWVPCQEEDELGCREAESRPFRFLIPDGRYQDWALMEGDVFSCRPPSKPDVLKGLSGYGGSLYLRKGPYNTEGVGICLARSVVDRGVVRGSFISSDSFLLYLRRKVEPDADFQLQLWNPGEDPVFLSTNELEISDDGVWRGLLPEEVGRHSLAGAISWGGERLGGWWSKDLYIPSNVENPELAACLIRYFHLPILSEDLLPQVRAFAAQYPGQILLAWLHTSEIADLGLVMPGDSDEWFNAVRQVFIAIPAAWKDGWLALYKTLGKFKECLELMLKVDPVIAVHMFKMGGGTAKEGQELLLGDIFGSQREQSTKMGECLVEAARETGSDPIFVKRIAASMLEALGASEPVPENLKLNYSVLCNRPAFRRYMAAKCFEVWRQ